MRATNAYSFLNFIASSIPLNTTGDGLTVAIEIHAQEDLKHPRSYSPTHWMHAQARSSVGSYEGHIDIYQFTSLGRPAHLLILPSGSTNLIVQFHKGNSRL